MENESFPRFIPISWRSDDYGSHEKGTDGTDLLNLLSQVIFGNNIKLAIRVKTNSFSKKLSKNYLDRKVTLELYRRPEKSPLNALFVQGMLNFFEYKSNQQHQHVICKSFKHLFKKGEEDYYCDIDASKISPNMWPEGRWIPLNIHGYISVNDPSMETDQYLFQGCPDPDVHKLSNDFQFLQFDKNHLSDITLKCFDVDIFAHRIILASRSAVFKAMLEKNTKEYQSGEIKITDIQPDALKKLLKYIYCAQMDELSEGSALELLYAADKYGVEDLKKTCVSYLKKLISNANVFRILNVAALHDEGLKFCAYEYIGNNFTEIEKSKEWDNLKTQNPALVYDILKHTVKFK